MELFGFEINTSFTYWLRFISWAMIIFACMFILWKRVLPNIIYTTKERTREKLAEKQKKQQEKQ